MFTFSRRFFSKPFFLGDKHPRPFSLSATSPPLRLSILTALMRPSLFYTLDFIITRDFTSLLREIPTHCYSDYKSLLLGLQIIITRDYKSLLREITNHYLNYTPAVHIHRRSEFTVDSFFLSTHTTSSVHSHSPRLRRRFAGPFLRRLCSGAVLHGYRVAGNR